MRNHLLTVSKALMKMCRFKRQTVAKDKLYGKRLKIALSD